MYKCREPDLQIYIKYNEPGYITANYMAEINRKIPIQSRGGQVNVIQFSSQESKKDEDIQAKVYPVLKGRGPGRPKKETSYMKPKSIL